MDATRPPYVVSSRDTTPIAVWRSGAGPPLVLVHGTAADHTRWAKTAPLLANDFTVHTIDRRGRGQSGDAPPYTVEKEGEDVAAVVAAIGGEVDVLGHSYGGLCALEGALRADVRRLILYEPPLPGDATIVAPEVLAQLDEHLAAHRREEALLTFFREVVGVPDHEIDALRKHPAWHGRVAAAHTLLRETRIEAEYRLDEGRLGDLKTPTLLLVGGDSAPAFHAAARRLHDALPDSRVVEMAGQKHMAMDTAPRLFLDLVGRFLR